MSRRRREARRATVRVPTWDDIGALAKAVREAELASAPPPVRPDLTTMTVAQLRQYAKDHGVDLKGVRLKAELITVLSA